MILSRRFGASLLGAYCSAMGFNAISNATELLAARYQVSLSELSPATSFYLLAEIAALPLVSVAVKRLGSQRLLTVALLGFLLASLFCMLSQSLNQLILSRTIQGFFGGFLLVLPALLIKLEVPEEQQAKTLTFSSFASAMAPITGPLLTSFMQIETVHIIFATMAMLTAAALLLVPPSTEQRPGPTPWPLMNMLVMVLCCSGLVSIVWGIENSQEWGGWHDTRMRLHIIIGAGLVLFATLHQWGRTDALLPVHVLKDLRYAGLLLSSLLVGVIVYGFIYLIPYYLIRIHQAGVQQLFHIALYVALPQLFFLPFILYLRHKISTYFLVCCGAAFGAFSIWQLTGIGLDFNNKHWLLPQGLRAIAVPMIVLPLSLLLLRLPSKEDAPALGSLFGLFRTLGGVIGISGLTVYTDSRQSHYEQIIMMNPGAHMIPTTQITQNSWLYAFNDTFTLVSFTFLGMLAYFVLLAKTQRNTA